MDSQREDEDENQGHGGGQSLGGGGLGGGSEDGSVDAGQGADCSRASVEASEGEGVTGGEAAQAQGPPPDRAPSGDSAHGTAPSRGQPLELCLTVHFLSFLEAEIARRRLLPMSEHLAAGVHKEITANDTGLTIRLMADNWNLLQIATVTMVTQLYVVVRTMQPHWPCFQRNLGPSTDS